MYGGPIQVTYHIRPILVRPLLDGESLGIINPFEVVLGVLKA